MSDSIRVSHQLIATTPSSFHQTFCNKSPNGQPMQRLIESFKMYSLKQMLDTLSTTSIQSTDFIDWSHVLIDICNQSSDEMCIWWTNLLTCALYWKIGDRSQAQQRYALVRNCPKQLLSNDLSLALGHAFCCRKLCIEDQSNKHYQQLVWIHCTKARRHLQSSLINDAISDCVRMLAFDWMLNSLLDVWQNQLDTALPYWSQPAAQPLLQLYHAVLDDYRRVVKVTDDTRSSRLMLLELYSRMMSACNPVVTYRLLLQYATKNTDEPRLSHFMQLHDSIARSRF
jgi:hypothetical protein